MPKGPEVCPDFASASISIIVFRIARAFASIDATSLSVMLIVNRIGSYAYLDEVEARFVVGSAHQRLGDEPQAELERRGDAGGFEMGADAFESLVHPQNDGVGGNHRLPVPLRNIAVHARHFKRPRLAPKCVLLSLQVVVADLDVFDGPYRLKLPPMHDLLLAEPRQGRDKISAPREDKKESVVYLDRLHVPLL